MNRANYYNVIEERLSTLAYRITQRGKLNVLDYHIHSENFYQYLLNKIYGWSIINENDIKHNVEAIDLIDHTNKLIIQVSATATKQKIESSLSKKSLQAYAGYTFKFVSIAKDADDLQKMTFINPYGVSFDPKVDIIDNKSLLIAIKGLENLTPIYDFVKKELSPDFDPMKLESNLAAIINILSKEDLNDSDSIAEITAFEIDRKILHNNLNAAKIIIEDYRIHYARVDRIYSEYDTQGYNKSSSVLSTIRQEYAKAKGTLTDDKLFFDVVANVREKVLNSSNYQGMPLDELELCVNILVVDAFIRCRIFENPNNYNYATT